MKRNSFTLVEVMIVIAIMSVLTAIAVPNLLRTRLIVNCINGGKPQKWCQSNLKILEKEDKEKRDKISKVKEQESKKSLLEMLSGQFSFITFLKIFLSLMVLVVFYYYPTKFLCIIPSLIGNIYCCGLGKGIRNWSLWLRD